MPAICQHIAEFCAREWPGPIFLRADNEYRLDLPACHRLDLPACHRLDLPACHRLDLPACHRLDLPACHGHQLGEWVNQVSDGPPSERIKQWISIGTNIIAPTTLLGALLFYFGYVSSRSQYAYFGVDVDTVGLSTQDYIMRSPQPLLVPLLVLPLAGAGILLANTAVRRRILSTTDAVGKANAVRALKRIVRGSAVFGLALLFAGIVLLFIYFYIPDWPFYGLVTPIVLASGGGLIAYASHLRRQMPTDGQGTKTVQAQLSAEDRLGSVPWTANLFIYALIVASIFWATATVAQWSGRGLAKSEALHLDRLPSVILDTKEPLFLHDPYSIETILPTSPGQTFHYRYRHLRLLIQGNGRMFLVPDVWSASDSTLVVPLDGSVRVQFQFQNDPP